MKRSNDNVSPNSKRPKLAETDANERALYDLKLFQKKSKINVLKHTVEELSATYTDFQNSINPQWTFYQRVVTVLARLARPASRSSSFFAADVDPKYYIPNITECYEFLDTFVEYLRKLVESTLSWKDKASDDKFWKQVYQIALNASINYCIDENTRQINIDAKHYEWLTKFPRADILEVISARLKDRTIDWPWKKYSMGNVYYFFDNLKQKKWTGRSISHERYTIPGVQFKTGHFISIQYQGPFDEKPSYYTFVSDSTDYMDFDLIVDYFQEDPRIRARRKDTELSPLEWWREDGNAEKLIRSMLEDSNNKSLMAHDIREKLFHHVKECTQFKPSLVMAVIQKMGATKFLDISAGWGDRLMGALASDSIVRYVATDPNRDLKSGHDEIIRHFASPETSKNYEIIYEPFQTAKLPENETYDLIFSSPPFFDFEIYTSQPGQSIQDFPQYEMWLVNFLFISLKKAWNVLEDGGHMVIHITNTRSSPCCEPMVLFVLARLDYSIYEGVISSLGGKEKPRPMWVWRKDSKIDNSTIREQAERHGRTHFANIWSMIDLSIPPTNLDTKNENTDLVTLS